MSFAVGIIKDKKINALKPFTGAIFKKSYLLIESFFGMSG